MKIKKTIIKEHTPEQNQNPDWVGATGRPSYVQYQVLLSKVGSLKRLLHFISCFERGKIPNVVFCGFVSWLFQAKEGMFSKWPGASLSAAIKGVLMPFVLVSMLSGCTNYTPEEYMKEIETNDEYVFHDTAGSEYMHVYYRPAEYLALRELLKSGRGFETITQKAFSHQLKDFSNGHYFNIKIGNMGAEKNIVIDGVQSREAYNRRIHALSGGLNRSFYMQTDDGGVVYPLHYNFYNTYGMGKTANFTVVFPVNELQDVSCTVLIYEDKIFGISRKLRVNVPLQEISSTPEISFKQKKTTAENTERTERKTSATSQRLLR